MTNLFNCSVGKSKILKILADDEESYEAANMFGDLKMLQEQIGKAGIMLMVKRYVIL